MGIFSDATPYFERQHLTFRRIDAAAPVLVADFLRQAEDFLPFLNKELTDAAALIAYCARERREDRMALYLAADAADAPIAGVILINRGKAKPDYTNLAYYVAPRHRGKGYAGRMIHGLLAELFDATALDTVFCAAWEDNASSLHVLKKAGFTDEGLCPSYIDPPPVRDHQFSLSREKFLSAIALDP